METYQNIYKHSRINAEFTQESAADFLHIATRTLGNYETGTAPVPDEVADRMVELYKDPFLGYQHARLNPVARRYLPEIERRALSQAALNLMCKSGMYMAIQTQMMEVAADGKIDKSETEAWSKVEDAARNLIASCFGLMFARND